MRCPNCTRTFPTPEDESHPGEHSCPYCGYGEEDEEMIFDGFKTHFVCPHCGHNDWTEGDARGEVVECEPCGYRAKVADA